jgi:hypothetical protein
MTADPHEHGHEPYKAHSGPDTVPAFTGLIVGGLVLFALLTTIVTITTKHYEAIEKAEAPASTS